MAADGSAERYFYTGLSRLVVKRRDAGSSQWRAVEQYFTKPGGAGNVLARQRAHDWESDGSVHNWEETPEHYHYNHMGSVAVVLDKWGGVISEPEQGRSLFGEVMVPGSGLAGSHGAQADFARPGLTTKHRDAAASAWGYGDSLPVHSVGKDYFGARWYDPSTARWLSEEPLGLDGPNMYNYLGGDAQTKFDSNGLWKMNIDLHVIGGGHLGFGWDPCHGYFAESGLGFGVGVGADFDPFGTPMNQPDNKPGVAIGSQAGAGVGVIVTVGAEVTTTYHDTIMGPPQAPTGIMPKPTTINGSGSFPVKPGVGVKVNAYVDPVTASYQTGGDCR